MLFVSKILISNARKAAYWSNVRWRSFNFLRIHSIWMKLQELLLKKLQQPGLFPIIPPIILDLTHIRLFIIILIDQRYPQNSDKSSHEQKNRNLSIATMDVIIENKIGRSSSCNRPVQRLPTEPHKKPIKY